MASNIITRWCFMCQSREATEKMTIRLPPEHTFYEVDSCVQCVIDIPKADNFTVRERKTNHAL